MPITEADRAFICGSSSPTVQIQMILDQRGGKMSLQELRGFYTELSEGRFRSTVYSMEAKGLIQTDGDTVELTAEPHILSISSRIWKAVTIKKVFSLGELVEIIPDISISTIRQFLTRWERVGALTRNDDTWTLKPGLRSKPKLTHRSPAKKEDDFHTSDLIRKVLEVLDSYGSGPFTPSDLIRDMGQETATLPFVRHLLTSWQMQGLVKLRSFNGQEYVYRVNRTLFRKIGWSEGKWKEEN